jgi:hypothetical protein
VSYDSVLKSIPHFYHEIITSQGTSTLLELGCGEIYGLSYLEQCLPALTEALCAFSQSLNTVAAISSALCYIHGL